jgi:hypothetical protein
VEHNTCLVPCAKGLSNVLEKKYNAQSKIVSTAIRELMTAPDEPKRWVGFHS